jgi:hypothetical protein
VGHVLGRALVAHDRQDQAVHPRLEAPDEGGRRKLTGNGFADDFSGTHFEWAAAGTDGATASSGGSGGSGANYPY